VDARERAEHAPMKGGLIRGGAAWLRPVPPEESERLRQKFVEHAERERREKFWQRVQAARQQEDRR